MQTFFLLKNFHIFILKVNLSDNFLFFIWNFMFLFEVAI